jgi:hypothetical protein
MESFWKAEVARYSIGKVTKEPIIRIRLGGELVVDKDARDLRNIWEAT